MMIRDAFGPPCRLAKVLREPQRTLLKLDLTQSKSLLLTVRPPPPPVPAVLLSPTGTANEKSSNATRQFHNIITKLRSDLHVAQGGGCVFFSLTFMGVLLRETYRRTN